MNFRKLKANEIDARVATVTEKGLSLLLYKDARVDMNILDETVGTENWQRSHELINGNLFCNVGIYIESRNEWVWKQDVGTESFTEKEKGQASDSFKRACFNWGIGRELYTAPFVWIGADKCNIKPKTNGQGFTCYDKFDVSHIGYDENGYINALTITLKGREVFRMGVESITMAVRTISENEAKSLGALLQKANVDIVKLNKQYHVNSLTELNTDQYLKILSLLNK